MRSSVIIVNYNGGERLKECLRSLSQDGCQPDEIILVDNASTDGSPEGLEQSFPLVRVVRSGSNLGFGEGNNLGARFATGDYLAFLNPDTVVAPEWLSAMVSALEADPKAGLVTAKILVLDDPERINTCGNDVHCTGLTLCRGMGLKRDALSEVSEVGAVSGAAFLIRRETFELLGGFDGSFFLYMEDTDLSWRARLAGYKSVYVPTSIVYHDYALRFGPDKVFYQERNRYLMLLKGLRWRTILVHLPILLLAEMVTWGYVLLREPRRMANKARAYAWVVGNWQCIMERRHHAQALRRVRDRDLIAFCSHTLAYEQADEGIAAHLARGVFDPVFFLFRRLALAVMWW